MSKFKVNKEGISMILGYWNALENSNKYVSSSLLVPADAGGVSFERLQGPVGPSISKEEKIYILFYFKIWVFIISGHIVFCLACVIIFTLIKKGDNFPFYSKRQCLSYAHLVQEALS